MTTSRTSPGCGGTRRSAASRSRASLAASTASSATRREGRAAHVPLQAGAHHLRRAEDRQGDQLNALQWPPLDAISRLSPDEEQIPAYASLGPGGEFGSTLAPLAEPSYRAPAWLIGGGLLAAALALLAFPATLVAREARRRRPQVETGHGPSALERALLRVERARDQGSAEEQREALEALAPELDGDARGSRVRALAWRPRPPAADETTTLLTDLRGADGAPV